MYKDIFIANDILYFLLSSLLIWLRRMLLNTLAKSMRGSWKAWHMSHYLGVVESYPERSFKKKLIIVHALQPIDFFCIYIYIFFLNKAANERFGSWFGELGNKKYMRNNHFFVHLGFHVFPSLLLSEIAIFIPITAVVVGIKVNLLSWQRWLTQTRRINFIFLGCIPVFS